MDIMLSISQTDPHQVLSSKPYVTMFNNDLTNAQFKTVHITYVIIVVFVFFMKMRVICTYSSSKHPALMSTNVLQGYMRR